MTLLIGLTRLAQSHFHLHTAIGSNAEHWFVVLQHEGTDSCEHCCRGRAGVCGVCGEVSASARSLRVACEMGVSIPGSVVVSRGSRVGDATVIRRLVLGGE